MEASDLPRRVDLAGEPLTEVRVGDVLGPDELDRDLAAAGRKAQVDPAHAAFAELAEKPVASHLYRITRLQRIHYPPQIPPHRPRDRSKVRLPGTLFPPEVLISHAVP